VKDAPKKKATAAWWKERLRADERIAVVGTSGSGKTWWVRKELLKANPRAFIFDPCGDYPELRAVTVAQLLADPGQLAPDKVQLAVRPVAGTYEDLAEQLCLFIDLCRRAGTPQDPGAPIGPCDALVVVEECSKVRGLYTERDASGSKRSTDYELGQLATDGRKTGLAVAYVAQRHIMIPPDARSQCRRVVSCEQFHAADLRSLSEQCGEEFAAKVQAWRRGAPPVIWSPPSLE
jgi:hypothetical protein